MVVHGQSNEGSSTMTGAHAPHRDDAVRVERPRRIVKQTRDARARRCRHLSHDGTPRDGHSPGDHAIHRQIRWCSNELRCADQMSFAAHFFSRWPAKGPPRRVSRARHARRHLCGVTTGGVPIQGRLRGWRKNLRARAKRAKHFPRRHWRAGCCLIATRARPLLAGWRTARALARRGSCRSGLRAWRG